MTLLEPTIQIVACCTIYVTSALSFLYLLLLIAISTYFAPLCGSIFGSPPETLNYLNQPKTEKYNFLFVSFTVPRENENNDKSIGLGDNNNINNPLLKQTWPLTSGPQTSNTSPEFYDKKCPEEKAWDHLRGDSQTIVMFVCGIIGLIVMIIISTVASCFACFKTSPKNNQYYMERINFRNQQQNAFENTYNQLNQHSRHLNQNIYNSPPLLQQPDINIIPDHILLQKNYSNNPRTKYCLIPFLIMTLILEGFTIATTVEIYKISRLFSIFIFNNLNQVIYHQFMKDSIFAQIDALKRVLLASIMFVTLMLNILQIVSSLFTGALFLLCHCQHNIQRKKYRLQEIQFQQVVEGTPQTLTVKR